MNICITNINYFKQIYNNELLRFEEKILYFLKRKKNIYFIQISPFITPFITKLI